MLVNFSRVPQSHWRNLSISSTIRNLENHQVLAKQTISLHDYNRAYEDPLDDLVMEESYKYYAPQFALASLLLPSKLSVTFKSKDAYGNIINEQTFQVDYNGKIIQTALWPDLTPGDGQSQQGVLLFDPFAYNERYKLPNLTEVHASKKYYLQRPFLDLKPHIFYQISAEIEKGLQVDCGPTHSIWNVFGDLLSRIVTYEALEKSDPKLIQSRIDQLGEISASARRLGSLLCQVDLKRYKDLAKKYELLAYNADNKALYLTKLARLLASPDELKFLEPSGEGDPFRKRGLFGLDRTLLGLRCIDSYWLEDLDPAHRRWGDLVFTCFNHPLYIYWKEHLSTRYTNFFLALEFLDFWRYSAGNEELRRRFERLQSLYTFDQTFKEENHVYAHNGRLVSPSQELLTTGEFGSIYTMDTTGELYLPLSKRFKALKISAHHNMLLEGRYALAAGHMKTKDGKITSIDNTTGHYQIPTNLFVRAIKQLYKKGVMDPKAEINIYFAGATKTFALEQFLMFAEENWEQQMKEFDQAKTISTESPPPQFTNSSTEHVISRPPVWDEKYQVTLSHTLAEFQERYNVTLESILSATNLSKAEFMAEIEIDSWLNFESYALPHDFKLKVYSFHFRSAR